MIKVLIWSSIMLLLFYLIACSPENDIKQYHLSGQTMGTTYNIKFIQPQIDSKRLSDIQNEVNDSLKKVNQKMSTYIEDSEVSVFNSFKDTSKFKISTEFFSVLQEAVNIYNLSDGAFDITVNPLVILWGFGNKESLLRPPDNTKINNVLKKIGTQHLILIDSMHIKKEIPELEIDLSAIAKGYGVDVVSGVFEKYNIQNYMVEIGGEVYTSGLNARGKKWGIGIDKPFYKMIEQRELQDTIFVSNLAVATSGDYRNYFEYKRKIYSHTINPKSGYPVAHNLASATVIAPNCMKADALATAAMVLGNEKGLELLEALENVEGMLLERLDNGKFKEHATSGFLYFHKKN